MNLLRVSHWKIQKDKVLAGREVARLADLRERCLGTFVE